jgi:hypothetical protein
MSFEAKRWSRGIAVPTFSRSDRWGWVVDDASRPLYSQERPGPRYRVGRVAPRTDLEVFGEEKISCTYLDSNPKYSSL